MIEAPSWSDRSATALPKDPHAFPIAPPVSSNLQRKRRPLVREPSLAACAVAQGQSSTKASLPTQEAGRLQGSSLGQSRQNDPPDKSRAPPGLVQQALRLEAKLLPSCTEAERLDFRHTASETERCLQRVEAVDGEIAAAKKELAQAAAQEKEKEAKRQKEKVLRNHFVHQIASKKATLQAINDEITALVEDGQNKQNVIHKYVREVELSTLTELQKWEGHVLEATQHNRKIFKLQEQWLEFETAEGLEKLLVKQQAVTRQREMEKTLGLPSLKLHALRKHEADFKEMNRYDRLKARKQFRAEADDVFMETEKTKMMLKQEEDDRDNNTNKLSELYDSRQAMETDLLQLWDRLEAAYDAVKRPDLVEEITKMKGRCSQLEKLIERLEKKKEDEMEHPRYRRMVNQWLQKGDVYATDEA